MNPPMIGKREQLSELRKAIFLNTQGHRTVGPIGRTGRL